MAKIDMSAAAERTVPGNRTARQEIVVDFEPQRLKAPFLLRCGALLIDYIVVVAIPVIGLLVNRFFGSETSSQVTAFSNDTAWLFAVLLGLSNFLLLPVLSGQTIGKMLTGLRIVTMDGRSVSFGSALLRHTLGYLLTALTLGLGFFIAVLNRNGRSLHDYVAGTTVVYGRRKVL